MENNRRFHQIQQGTNTEEWGNTRVELPFGDIEIVETRAARQMLLFLLLDLSRSMCNKFSNGKTRWECVIVCLIQMLDGVQKMIPAGVELRVNLMLVNDTFKWMLRDKPMDEIDLEQLRTELTAMIPNGTTALGTAMAEMLETMKSDKKRKSDASIDVVAQPIVAVFSDGLPTDTYGNVDTAGTTMQRAYELADEQLSGAHCILLPFAIMKQGTKKTEFTHLLRLVKAETVEKFRRVYLSCEMQHLQTFVRFLGRTVVSVASTGNRPAAVPPEASLDEVFASL